MQKSTQVSAWNKWSSCTKPCGFGESQRLRSVKREAEHDGIPCPVLLATRTCNDFHCPVNCTVSKSIVEDKALKTNIQVSGWSEWSSCSKSCHWGDPGQSRRGRDIVTQPGYNGASCPVLDDTKSCNDFLCPIDCKVD